jgi:chromosome partitioning protein
MAMPALWQNGHSSISEKLVTDGPERDIDRDMKIIAIANQKGGTAKTTTTAALGVLLSRSGYRTHLVDMDPQSSLSQAFGQVDTTDGLYLSMKDRAELPVHEIDGRLTLTPSSLQLSRIETELLSEIGREHFLRTSLEKTDLPADAIVLLDCPPSLGILSVNCLCTAGGLIVVVQPGGFELHAFAHLDMTVHAIRKQANPDLTLLGTIMTNCHKRRLITGQVREQLSQVNHVLGVIRSDARILYATTAGTMHRLKRSNAMEDYAEVVERLEESIA